MRFLLGWTVKLGFLAVVYLAMTGNLRVQLPETVLGYAQVGDIANMTQTGLKQISDSFK